MMNKLKLWLGIVSIFLIGVIIGGLVSTMLIRNHMIRIRRHGPPRMHELVSKRLIGNIDLTNDQREEIQKIVEEFEPRFLRFDGETRAGIQRIMDEMSDQIRTALTPEQRESFDDNLNRMKEKYEKRKKGMRKWDKL